MDDETIREPTALDFIGSQVQPLADPPTSRPDRLGISAGEEVVTEKHLVSAYPANTSHKGLFPTVEETPGHVLLSVYLTCS